MSYTSDKEAQLPWADRLTACRYSVHRSTRCRRRTLAKHLAQAVEIVSLNVSNTNADEYVVCKCEIVRQTVSRHEPQASADFLARHGKRRPCPQRLVVGPIRLGASTVPRCNITIVPCDLTSHYAVNMTV